MAEPAPALATRRIVMALRLTLAGLWAERIVRAFWPLWSIMLALLAGLSFGLQDRVPLEAAWIFLVGAGLGALAALVWGLRAFRRPTRAEAIERLDSRLPGRPLAALADRQAIGGGDPASAAVWAAHRTRMAQRAAAARPVEPDLRLAARDRFGLRYMALTAMVMALLFGSVWRVATATSLGPGGADALAGGPTWEGWVQPPPYTGKPTLYLADIDGDLAVPEGSRIQIRLYGEVGSLTLSETVSGRSAADVPPASDVAQDFTVVQSGRIAIDGPGGRDWQVTVIEDAPPTVLAKGEIGREADGRFRQAFDAQDDYGVTAGRVTIALDLAATDRRHGLATDPEPREAVTLDLPLPITGKRDSFSETLIDDLSQHPFANLPVTMTFTVVDAAGQEGSGDPLKVVLPGRRFFDPLAAALVEMRRDLLWNRSNAVRTVQILKAVTHRPEEFIRNERAYLRLRVALRRLDAAAASLSPQERDEIAEELWQIALLVEEGDLASALERLQRAQDRLDEAIRNGASKEEIDELMQEMQQALNDYMRELAEEAQRNPDSQTSQNMEGMQMSGDQLQQMLDELQKLMEEGRMAEAQELMEMLRQLMENMQVVEGQGGGQGGPGQQAMRDLGETLRDQQELSDEAFNDLQDGEEGNEGQRRRPGQQGQGEDGQDEGGQEPGQNPGSDPGEGPGQLPDDRSLAERQGDLRERLDRLNRGGQLPGAGTEPGEAGRQELDRAGRAMDEAEQALREGDLPGAMDRQAEAMEALREGMRNLGEALAQEQQPQQPGEGQPGDERFGQADPRSQRDPLGRAPGESARIGSDRNMLQGPDVYRRAQDLLDEIRRRSGEQLRPEEERDYLRRLLDLF